MKREEFRELDNDDVVIGNVDFLLLKPLFQYFLILL